MATSNPCGLDGTSQVPQRVRKGPDPDGGVGGPPKKRDKLISGTSEYFDRKEKAIGFLTQRILERLPDKVESNESWEMTVEHVTQAMGCSKGSAYEVFHVLESLLMVIKVGQSTYRWLGTEKLTKTLMFLRHIAMAINLRDDMDAVRREDVAQVAHQSRAREQKLMGGLLQHPAEALKGLTPDECQVKGTSDVSKEDDGNEENTMHILTICHRFIMQFLIMDKPRVLSLEFASKVINYEVGQQMLDAESNSDGKEQVGHVCDEVQRVRAMCKSFFPKRSFSGCVRRLYDVSNILANLKQPLLRKVRTLQFGSTNRNSLQYIGPDIDVAPELTRADICSFKGYRQKHLLFSLGKEKLGIPELPPFGIPMTTTVRLKAGPDGRYSIVPRSISGVDMDKASVIDRTSPITFEEIKMLELERMRGQLSSSRRNRAKLYEEIKKLGGTQLTSEILSYPNSGLGLVRINREVE